MPERTRFQSQILLQLSRLARWCSGLARSYSSKRKGLHRSVRLRSNTCTSTTRFRKFRGTEFRTLGQDSRFESSFANSDPSWVAVYPRDSRSRRVLCRSSQSLHCILAAPAALDRYLAALPAMSLIPVAPFTKCLRLCTTTTWQAGQAPPQPKPKQSALPVNLILDNASRSFALSRFARNSPEHFLKE